MVDLGLVDGTGLASNYSLNSTVTHCTTRIELSDQNV